MDLSPDWVGEIVRINEYCTDSDRWYVIPTTGFNGHVPLYREEFTVIG